MSTAIVAVDAPSSDLSPAPTIWQSNERAHSALQSLSQIITPPLSSSSSSSEDPAFDLLHDPRVASAVSRRLCMPGSGAGDDNLCRWLYDTFQSTDPSLQLAVLRFLPTLAGLYLSRCTGHRHYQPLAGFEAVLLALYAHETVARAASPLTVDLPNLSAPNPYQDLQTSKTVPAAAAAAAAKGASKNAEEPVAVTAVLSHKLEPHGTMRSTRRARVVGVALELYYSKISSMPNQSKLEFCEFASAWSGRYASPAEEPKDEKGEEAKEEELPPKPAPASEVPSKEEEAGLPEPEEPKEEGLPKPEEAKEGEEEGLPNQSKEAKEEEEEEEEALPKPEEAKEEEVGSQESEKFVDCPEEEEPGEKGERIPLPWELIQPTLRILGHCLLAPSADDELRAAASAAVKSLYQRAVHDMNPQAVLATRSLIRLEKMADAAYEPPPPASASEMSETAIVAV